MGLSYGCPLRMRMEPPVGYVAHASPVYFPELKK
jgi:hypothetical protein